MGLRCFSGLLGGVSVLLVASLSHAQCSKDTDCKGDRVCEGGSCVAPTAPLPPPPDAPPTAAAPVSQPAPAGVAPQMVEAPREEEPPAKPKMQRHSTGMMVGGIVMTSLAPIALLVAMVANVKQSACEGGLYYSSLDDDSSYRDCSKYDTTIYGGLLVGGGLLAAGIPMIVIGAKKEPIGTASVTPWVTAHGGGLGIRLDM